jgi:hypothetical protein
MATRCPFKNAGTPPIVWPAMANRTDGRFAAGGTYPLQDSYLLTLRVNHNGTRWNTVATRRRIAHQTNR